MLNLTFKSQTFRQLNKIPNSRQLFNSFLGFMTNVDDLWLYNYHDRNYDVTIENTFSAVA